MKAFLLAIAICQWLAIVFAAIMLTQPSPVSTTTIGNSNPQSVPDQLCSPYGTYPNPLGITDGDRQSFHPVIKFPIIWSDSQDGRTKVANVVVADHTRPSERPQMATEEERLLRRQAVKYIPRWFRHFSSRLKNTALSLRCKNKSSSYGIGRYDENRIGMYSSELFLDKDNSIDGYAGARTVHVGIDLGGPIGTPVYAISDGVIHSLGYNADLGDYGNVVVVEHTIPSNGRRLWALYGHLDTTSTRGKFPGQQIRKGQRIGRLGDIHENGGWHSPHVHFQIATEAPQAHDMPGAVAVDDRPKALLHYPDPRWVLGMLY